MSASKLLIALGTLLLLINIGFSYESMEEALYGDTLLEEGYMLNESYVIPSTPPQECEEYWVCSEWSKCINGIQRRYCVDNNECGTNYNKPPETRECEVNETLSSESYIQNNEPTRREGRNIQTQTQEQQQNRNITDYIFLAFFGLLSISSLGASAYYMYRYIKSSKSNKDISQNTADNTQAQSLSNQYAPISVPSDLLRWVQYALSQGYSDDQIRATLQSSGWSIEIIEEALRRAKQTM